MQAVRDPMSSDDAPRAVKLDPADFMVHRKPGEDGFTDDDFWESRAELSFIRDGARSYITSPWAVLAYAILLVVDQVDPRYVLPPITGGYGSLNNYIAIVGNTGAGKNSAMRAAKLLLGIKAVTRQMSTGEGIVATYCHWDAEAEDYVMDETAAIFECDEVDRYRKLTQRTGATLDDIIRTMWNGDDTGQMNATVELRRHLDAHTYRLGVVLGVQPSRGDALMSLGAVTGGTTGRFAWMPCTDPDMPDVDDLPRRPDRCLTLNLPGPPPRLNQHGVFPIIAHPMVERALMKEQVARRRGELDDDINAHAMMVRFKLAAGLGLLNGHIGVREDDWHLAGHAMTVSCRTRDTIVDRLRVDAAEKTKARGREQAEVEMVAEAVKDEQAEKDVQRVCNLLLTRAAKGGKDGDPWVNRSDLRTALASRDRKKYFDDAVMVLADSGRLLRRAVEHYGQQGEQFCVPR